VGGSVSAYTLTTRARYRIRISACNHADGPQNSNVHPPASRPADMTAPHKTLRIALAVALAVCAGSSRGDDKDGKNGDPKDLFAKTFRPILEKYCYRCHGEETQKADLNLAKYKTTADVDLAGDVFSLVVARLRAAEMPPPGSKQLTFNEGRDFRNW